MRIDDSEHKSFPSYTNPPAQPNAAVMAARIAAVRNEADRQRRLKDRTDAYKRIGANQRGQKCGRGWVGLKGACKRAKKGASEQERKALGKESAKTLAAKIKAERAAAKAGGAKNAALAGAANKKGKGIGEIDPSTIAVDPKRFQYKILGEHTQSGSVGSLGGVKKYDPNLAGIMQVWNDPADGKTYIVNGHNRLDLAKKLGADEVAVRYLDAPDAKTARAIGALTNIAEGRGNALDAAKFFRDTGISKQDLEAKGIPMKEKIANDGLNLSKLDDSLFRKTIDGELSIPRASIIGGSGLEAAAQRDLVKLIEKQGKKKSLTDGAIQEMVDIAKSSQQQQETTLSLFGEETVTKTNMIEKAKLQSAVKRRLSREKNLFGTVSKSQAAKDLERGGNQIDIEQSGKISDKAKTALGTFDRLKNLSGPVSDAINRAANRVANGEPARKVERELYDEILNVDALGGRKAA